MTRTLAREQAFLLLFERAFREESMEEILESAVEGRQLNPDKYAVTLAVGTDAQIIALDAKIQELSTKWKINRISKVSLTVLRLALWEIDNVEKVPVGTTIDDAVELAKKYGADDDYSFVNGVLGSYVRKDAE